MENSEYIRGWKECCKETFKMMKKLWNQYEKDPDNVPKPDFVSAVALISVMEDYYARRSS